MKDDGSLQYQGSVTPLQRVLLARRSFRRYAEGAVFPDGFAPENTDPAVRAMVEAYRSAYQEDPDILAAQAYDATQMVLSLIKSGKDTPLAIRDGLLGMKERVALLGGKLEVRGHPGMGTTLAISLPVEGPTP